MNVKDIYQELNHQMIVSASVLLEPNDKINWGDCQTLVLQLVDGSEYQIWGPASSLFMQRTRDRNQEKPPAITDKELALKELTRIQQHPDFITYTKWKHYKGRLYQIHFISLRENDLSILVTYTYRKDNFDNNLQYWTRPLDDFYDSVTLPDGTQVPRFVPEACPWRDD